MVAELVVVLVDVYGGVRPSMILLKIFSSKLLLRIFCGRYFELAYKMANDTILCPHSASSIISS